MADFTLERGIPGPVAGIDEAGRGPAAGPVVAAAVILDPATAPDGLDDSKRLSPARRAELFAALLATAQIGVGIAEPAEIDRVNILAATMRAMRRALDALPAAPAFALVDGDRVPPGLPCLARAVVGGDGLSASIAAASIVAKTTRDRLMAEAHARWPSYGFAGHVGYGTSAHREALLAAGPCPLHRRSWATVREALAARAATEAAPARPSRARLR